MEENADKTVEAQNAEVNTPLDVAGNAPKDESIKTEDAPGQEKLSGVSTASFDEEQLRRAVYNGENDIAMNDVPKAKPMFFIKGEDVVTIEVDVLTDPKTGRVMSVTKSGYGIDFEKNFSYFVHTLLKFEFSVPNYIQLSEYRRRCTTLDSETDKPIVDRVKLREFLLVNHLQGWNLTDTEDRDIPLKFDETGILSDVSLLIAHSLTPAILDVVFTVFEKDVLLI